jgi:hypothetical protein
VQFSGDNGVNWSNIPTTTLKGDFGSNIIAGRKRVTWNPVVDLVDITISGDILCRLSLYDVEAKLATGDVLTGALVMNLNKSEIAIMRL